MTARKAPLLSVVVPAYNEATQLPRLLRSLKRQAYPADRFEVIVVDNGSTDATAAVARRFGVRVVSEREPGPSFARRRGFAAARGQIIVSTDADCRVPPTWLAEIDRRMADPRIDALAGGFAFIDGPQLGQRLVARLLPVGLWIDHKLSPHFSGTNFAIRRGPYESVGGFPTELTIGEDFALSDCVRRAGFRIASARDLIVETSSRQFEYRPGRMLGLFVLHWAVRVTRLPGLDRLKRRRGHRRVVALTFDDGPCRPATPDILKILKRFRVPATFFLVGENVRRAPELARQIADEGHLIGNHSDRHRFFGMLQRPSRIVADARRADRSITKSTGRRPRYYRPPYGIWTPWGRRAIRRAGYQWITWDVMPRDYRGLPAAQIVQKILDHSAERLVVVLHDGHSAFPTADRANTVAALPQIIRELKARDYEFLRVDEL